MPSPLKVAATHRIENFTEELRNDYAFQKGIFNRSVGQSDEKSRVLVELNVAHVASILLLETPFAIPRPSGRWRSLEG